jgi:hypothetical protein
MPVRIQRTRTKGAKLPPNTICCTRPGKYSNRFKVGEVNTDTGQVITIDKCLEYFEFEVRRRYQPAQAMREFLAPLRKADYLACWCKPQLKCHVDVLLKLLGEIEEKGK